MNQPPLPGIDDRKLMFAATLVGLYSFYEESLDGITQEPTLKGFIKYLKEEAAKIMSSNNIEEKAGQ